MKAVSFILAWILGCSLVWADDKIESRDALRDGRYETVVVLTKRIAAQEPGLASNWYRMAIAATRTGDAALGALALSNARLHDPSLSFASSPARIVALEAEIARADPQGPLPLEQVRADALEMFKDVLPAPEPSAAPAPAAPVGLDDSKQRMDALSEQVQALGVVLGPVEQYLRWGALSAGVVLLAGVLLAWSAAVMIRRHSENAKAAELERRAGASMIAREVAQLPLGRLIAFSRNYTLVLRQRLQSHGREETALFQALGHYIPVLEVEAARSGMDDDLEKILGPGTTVDDMPRMAPARPVLGERPPGELHDRVLSVVLPRADNAS